MELDLNFLEDHFSQRLIFKDTWMIATKTDALPYSSDCYLLSGDESAIAIDSGMHILNIAEYMQSLTPVPICGVINTHGHFDHTGGNGFFKKTYMHPAARKPATTPFGNAEGYILDYPIVELSEGYTIDLGGRVLEIMFIGAHSLDSIAILDRTNRILFTGDELETGWINVGSFRSGIPGMTIETHYKNILKLKARYDEYDFICPAHHGAPIDKSAINDFLICDKMILDGAPGSDILPHKVAGGRSAPGMRILRYKSAHICFNVDGIFEKKG